LKFGAGKLHCPYTYGEIGKKNCEVNIYVFLEPYLAITYVGSGNKYKPIYRTEAVPGMNPIWKVDTSKKIVANKFSLSP
jgi:hypothetical protein